MGTEVEIRNTYAKETIYSMLMEMETEQLEHLRVYILGLIDGRMSELIKQHGPALASEKNPFDINKKNKKGGRICGKCNKLGHNSRTCKSEKADE